MRLLCVIDHFGSGGAQRQMVNLACGLKARGHLVDVFVYFPQYNFFRPQIVAAQIPIFEIPKRRGFSLEVLRKMHALLEVGKYDVVISFLASPNMYSELVGAFHTGSKMVVSERGSHYGDRSIIGSLLTRLFHVFADRVVTNNVSHALWLRRYPWLKDKVVPIYNGLEPFYFEELTPPEQVEELRLIAIGTIRPGKNCLGLMRAMEMFFARNGYMPKITWVGARYDSREGSKYWREIGDVFKDSPQVASNWSWLGERDDIPELLAQHHALIHPSFHEGLPNVVCEALFAGRPVLASDVCDHPMLVKDGERGYLFDPKSSSSIVSAIEKLSALDGHGWRRFSNNARRYAFENLGIDKYIDSYEAMLSEVIRS